MRKYFKGVFLAVLMVVFVSFMNVKADTIIDTINISGITPPIVGNVPSVENITSTTEGVTLTTKQWQVYSTSVGNISQFESGVTYGLFLNFELEEGYVLANEVAVVTNVPYIEMDDRFPSFIYLAYQALETHTVSFNMSGVDAEPIDPVTVVHGNLLPAPELPEAVGYNFVAWYKEPAFENVFEFESDTITEDTILYAKWVELGGNSEPNEPVYDITFDYNGGTHNGNGTEVFHWVSFGYIVTVDNCLEDVVAPTGKTLDYLLVDDEVYNFGSVIEISHNMTIKYIWRDANQYVSVQDVVSAYNNGMILDMYNMMYAGDNYVAARYDSGTNKILVEAGETLLLSFNISDNSAYYEDLTTVITEENCGSLGLKDNLITAMQYAVIDAAGYGALRISAEYDEVAATGYATYGLTYTTENYHFEGEDDFGSWSTDGSIIRTLRMSFSRDLVDQLVGNYGQSLAIVSDPEVRDDLFPSLSLVEVEGTSVKLRLSLPGMTDEDDPYIYIERSLDGDDYELASDRIGYDYGTNYIEWVDEDLAPNTTYYYRAFITGNGNESSVVTATTGLALSHEYIDVLDVVEAYNEGPVVALFNATLMGNNPIVARYDSDNNMILVESNGETLFFFDVVDNSVYYENLDTVLTEDNASGFVFISMLVSGMEFAIPEAAGYNYMGVSEEYAGNGYGLYGLEYTTEDYYFGDEESHEEGTVLRTFRMSLDTDLIDNLMDDYGESYAPEVEVVPVLSKVSVTDTTATIRVTLPETTPSDGYVCYVMRADDLDDWFVTVSDEINCSSTSVNFVDTELEPDTTYYYKAVASLDSEYGEYSEPIEVKTNPVVVLITKAPVVKTAKGNNNTVDVSWAAVDGAVRYDVYGSSNKKKWSKLGSTTDTSFVSTGLTYGKTYYYKVTAVGTSNSKTSSVVSGKTIPNTVENFTAPAVSVAAIKLSWDKVAVTGYQIQRKNGSKWVTIKTITKNSTLSFVNTKLSANKAYSYRIRAYKTVGRTKVYGAWTTLTAKTTPAKPAGKLYMRNYREVGIVIGKVSGATHYVVEKSLDGVTYEVLEDLPGPGTLADGNLDTGTKYYYRIKACTEELCSPWTSGYIVASTVTPTFALKTSSKKVAVTVTPVEGATGYVVYRSTKKNSGYKRVGILTTEEDVYTLINSTRKGTTYYYKVRAYVELESETVYSALSSYKKIRSK